MEKIAVFGSAFNPPSLGHKSVIDSLNHFDRILLVPSISHAWGKEMLDFDIRCQLIEAFIKDIDSTKVILSKLEQELVTPGKSVTTYEVLTKIEQIFPHSDITFVIGPDNLLNFDKFYKSSEILQRWSIMVCPERIPVRSTEIRRRLSENAEIRDLTTPSVEGLLKQLNVY